ncbi:MAG: hypothetical protein S4CHLAM81_09250 [Chlamydiales bacterium]|nr:hypothetical protein [Chlamydiales bacterium]MCH9635704.1 hypothetical protein [Chlamydiales bacterium]
MISFSMAEDKMPFVMSWRVHPENEQGHLFSQTVEVDDFQETMRNNFCVSEVKSDSFVIELENHLVGRVRGKGVISSDAVAWEFRENEQGFEGFEIYERQGDGYKMRAEFSAGDGLRTFIFGTITPA